MTATRAAGISEDRSGWRGMFWNAFIRSSNPMALMDEQRRFVEVNGACLQLLGYSRDQLIGMHFADVSASGQVFRQREWEQVLKQRQFIGVRELKRADGLIVRVEFAGHIETFTRRPLVLVVAIRSSRGSRKLHPRKERLVSSGALTPRELEVVSLVAGGYSGPEIAQKLHLSHNTVRTHTRNAMDKTGARTRAHLVAKVLAEGTLWVERESRESLAGDGGHERWAPS
jgi:PAS domain S-box-containing protein